MDKYRILFVDDEINILKSLKRGLRLHCPDWHVKFCISATDALLLLKEFQPLVVVSDKRMPGM
ncbi:MAG: DNA-binding NtrC family response regulator, partial [Cognaticolwellia sp.]